MKKDISKIFEYGRSIHISFHNNLDISLLACLNLGNSLLDLLNRVNYLSSNFNYIFYKPKYGKPFKTIYFSQDIGLHFFLKMQKDVMFYNFFIDKFYHSFDKPNY